MTTGDEDDGWRYRATARHHRDQTDADQVHRVRRLGDTRAERRMYGRRADEVERRRGYDVSRRASCAVFALVTAAAASSTRGRVT